jgi:hypothetical protein
MTRVPHSFAVDGSDGTQLVATGGWGSFAVLPVPPQAARAMDTTTSATDIHIVRCFGPPARRPLETFMVISLSEIQSLQGYNAGSANSLTRRCQAVAADLNFPRTRKNTGTYLVFLS